MLFKSALTLILFLAVTSLAAHDIRDYGALADDDSLEAERKNQQAFTTAIIQANYTEAEADREVIVPAGFTFHMLSVKASYISNLTITIDGTLMVSKRHQKWSTHWDDAVNKTQIDQFMEFREVHNFVIRGSGTVDGQGYMWWVREYFGNNKYNRPHLLWLEGGTNLEFTGVRWVNSPFYHMWITDFDGAYFHDFEIFVNVKGQLELDKLLLGDNGIINGLGGLELPTFPLNTDGIDPSGKNALIERVNITNYDDAVAVKQMTTKGKYATCSENIIIRDSNVWFGVGMTIGSIIPDVDFGCVRNVQFMNIKMYHPFKAIYIKNNPGWT